MSAASGAGIAARASPETGSCSGFHAPRGSARAVNYLLGNGSYSAPAPLFASGVAEKTRADLLRQFPAGVVDALQQADQGWISAIQVLIWIERSEERRVGKEG